MNQSRLHELLSARLKNVRRDLEEALDQALVFPLTTAPGPGVRTLEGQIQEIIATESNAQDLIRGHPLRDYATLETGAKRASWSEYRDLLDRAREETEAILRSFSLGDLENEVDVPRGFSESLGLRSVPRAEIFRSIAAHEWYHTGQIVTTLWAAGRDPYDW